MHSADHTGTCRCDPAHVIAAAIEVDPARVENSSFMDAYASSLRTAIKQGVEVRALC